MSQATIIFGFPGIGKTYAFLHQAELNLKLVDSDSSEYHWTKDDEGNKIAHPDWPKNYIDHVVEIGNSEEKIADYILMSTHEEVMNAMKDKFETMFCLIPDKEAKDYFIDLYKNRGNDEAFIAKLSENWESWIRDTMSRAFDNNCTVVIIGPDRHYKTLYDFLKNPPKMAMDFDK